MPGGLAIAALSHALRFRLRQVIAEEDSAAIGQIDVVTRAPEQMGTPAITRATLVLYPYRIVPNAGWQSSRGAPYNAAGERQADPLLALDVHYLLAAYSPNAGLPDLALGLGMLALHETPQLTAALLEAAAADSALPGNSPLPQAVQQLADQDAPIKLSTTPLELEGLSQLWSMMNSGLRVGMTYQVSTLLLERQRRRASAPPVREGRLGLTLLRAPFIARLLVAPADPAQPFAERALAAPGERLRLVGSGLAGDVTEVWIGDRTLTVTTMAADAMEAAVPADLRPGLSQLRLRHLTPKPVGTLPPPGAGTIPVEQSNLVAIAIRPVLRAANPFVSSGRAVDDGVVRFTVTVHFAVAVGRLQRAELLLNAVNADANGRFPAYVFQAPDPAPGTADAAVTSRTFTIAGVTPGPYLARVIIDGAESALTSGAAGYDGPIATVPA
ncbi:Pvc16 family protein [Erythrobacter donghaensis]|uniref:Pvc16 family protein n=1 Tax=Erythrobacter donghaensis TaxID=267135 RepID=UPI000A3BD661|nr:Pvc16 family protein [Erythrobacter donghaensis]